MAGIRGSGRKNSKAHGVVSQHGRNCGNSLQLVDLIPETTMQEQFMKLFPILFAIMISTTFGATFAQEMSTSGANAETAPAPEIEACRASGLIAL
jgi:hypothetical protein